MHGAYSAVPTRSALLRVGTAGRRPCQSADVRAAFAHPTDCVKEKTMNIHDRSWPSEGLTRIPYWIYSDRDLYAEEQARIFRGDAWTFLCLEAELPGPNTFRTSTPATCPGGVPRARDGSTNASETAAAIAARPLSP